MAVVSLAILDKNKKPIYMKEFIEEDAVTDIFFDERFLFGMKKDDKEESKKKVPFPQCSLKQEFIFHAAVDRLEQMSGPPPSYDYRTTQPDSDGGMFVGLVCPVQELRVYGYVTTTKITFLLVLEDEALSPPQQKAVNQEIKNLFVSIHQLYVEDMLNPFKEISFYSESSLPIITSKRFDLQVQNYIDAYNQSETI